MSRITSSNAYDWLLARRTLALFLASSVGVFGVMLATDEPGSTFSLRLARYCVLVPAVAALSAALAAQGANQDGSQRGLRAIGVSPARSTVGAVVSASLVSALAALLVQSPLSDPSSVFPLPPESSTWERNGGGFVERETGTVWDRGHLILKPTPAILPTSVNARLGAAALVLGLGLVLPTWACQRSPQWTRLVVGAVTLLALLWTLHAVAVAQAPAWAPLASLVVLAGHTLATARSSLRGR